MTLVPEERRLFREAADLAIRLQNDPGNKVALDTVRAWVARSPRHAAAWSRIAEIHGMAGKVLTDQRKEAEGGALGLSRRALVIGGMAGIGAAATGALTIPRALLHAKADYLTSTGEIRRITLADGTAMTLGPDSAVALDYGAARRGVALLAGMAYFEVAPVAGPPFSARSGPLSATARDTAFDLSSDAGFISASVDRGSLEVSAPGLGTRPAEPLNAGDWITLDPSESPTRGTRDATQIGAWRSGMIIAENEAVSAVVARIARWQRGSVVLADPSLGARAVSGVFDLSDPTRALEAAVRPFGAKVRRIPPFVTLISPV